MVQKVHGYSAPGNKTGKELNYYKIRTLLDITPTGVVEPMTIGGVQDTSINQMQVYPFTFNGITFTSAADYQAKMDSQQRFDLLIQTISLRAQPILLGGVMRTTEMKSAITDIAAVENVDPWMSMSSTDLVDVYTVMFAIEHNLAWEPVGNQPNLAESLDGVMDFSYANPSDPDNNLHVELLGNLLQ